MKRGEERKAAARSEKKGTGGGEEGLLAKEKEGGCGTKACKGEMRGGRRGEKYESREARRKKGEMGDAQRTRCGAGVEGDEVRSGGAERPRGQSAIGWGRG